MPLRAGATLVVDADGVIRYVIAKPMPFAGMMGEVKEAAERREASFRDFVALSDASNPNVSWGKDEASFNNRMLRLGNLRTLHGGL